jgi:hypothetical protein
MADSLPPTDCVNSGGTWNPVTGRCDFVHCPPGSDKENQQVPVGETVETWCNVSVGTTPTLCAVGTYKEGQQVPAGETADVWCADPYAQAKIDCKNTVGGATWDDTNKVCTPAATADRFAAEKEACALLTGQEWNEYYMACVPVNEVNADGSAIDPNLDLTALDNAANAKLSALGSTPVGTTLDPYSLGPDIGVVGPTPGGPAIPSTVPNINDVNFGALGVGGGFGYAANTAAGASGGGAEGAFGGENMYGGGFAHGGEVEDRLGQRQNASDSRLMRHAGLGQFADEIGDEMLSTIARIMDRKD